jgi:hypothetical protein
MHRIAEVRPSRARRIQERLPVLTFMFVEPPQEESRHLNGL